MQKRNKKLDLFYIPAILLFLIFVVYPFINGIYLSFTNWNGYSEKFKMIGFDNYVRMLTDETVLTAFRNTLIYGIGSTIIQNVLGILLAVFLNQNFKGKGIVRTIIYLPVMIAPLIMGYIMYFFFTYNNGAINDVLGLFHVAPVDWLADGDRSIIILTFLSRSATEVPPSLPDSWRTRNRTSYKPIPLFRSNEKSAPLCLPSHVSSSSIGCRSPHS